MSSERTPDASPSPTQPCPSEGGMDERHLESSRVDESGALRLSAGALPVLAAPTNPVVLFARQPEGSNRSAKASRHWVILGDSYSAQIKRNWLGHLTSKYTGFPGMTLHNFAIAGDTAEEDLSQQVGRLFRKYPSIEVFGEGERSKVLVVIWIGINDCGRNDPDDLPAIVEIVFDAVHKLYTEWKARAFLLIDVPPMHRSPGGACFLSMCAKASILIDIGL
ncbi:hypothetical protein NMY22_g16575 [Coprinellus aureogranulatus]|nr:hypothetical protein NMY22_g16575 [Coprinellus aureogranulatus]